MANFENIIKSALISGVIVPTMGVLAHLAPHKGAFAEDDASLSNRFECAYTFNPNPARRTYTSYEYKKVNSYPEYYKYTEDNKIIDRETGHLFENSWIEHHGNSDKLCNKENYIASPYMIYPLHILIAWLAYIHLRRCEQEKLVSSRRRNPYSR